MFSLGEALQPKFPHFVGVGEQRPQVCCGECVALSSGFSHFLQVTGDGTLLLQQDAFM